jgi:hypothetical protein
LIKTYFFEHVDKALGSVLRTYCWLGIALFLLQYDAVLWLSLCGISPSKSSDWLILTWHKIFFYPIEIPPDSLSISHRTTSQPGGFVHSYILKRFDKPAIVS